MRLLTDDCRGSFLPLTTEIPSENSQPTTVLDVLISKHPPSQPANPDTITNVNHSNVIHSIIFDGIDASAIKSAVLQTEGSAGPSGIDAKGWRRLCTSFHSASVELCKSLAALARRLCPLLTPVVLLLSWLVALLRLIRTQDRVRPIGICEVTRRIISKAVLSILRVDIQEAAGSIQLCAGQISSNTCHP